MFDKIGKQCYYVTLGEDKSEYIKTIAKEEHEIEDIHFEDEGYHFSKEQYENMVLEAKERFSLEKFSKRHFKCTKIQDI